MPTQSAAQSATQSDEGGRLDDDLRKVLKRLPASTKRNLLQELESEPRNADASVAFSSLKQLGGPSPSKRLGDGGRRATAPTFSPPPIAEDASVEVQQAVRTAYSGFGIFWIFFGT